MEDLAGVLVEQEVVVKRVELEGVTEEYAGSPDEMLEMLQRGTANRAIASTNMNSVCCRVWCGGCAALPAVAVVWSLMGVR